MRFVTKHLINVARKYRERDNAREALEHQITKVKEVAKAQDNETIRKELANLDHYIKLVLEKEGVIIYKQEEDTGRIGEMKEEMGRLKKELSRSREDQQIKSVEAVERMEDLKQHLARLKEKIDFHLSKQEKQEQRLVKLKEDLQEKLELKGDLNALETDIDAIARKARIGQKINASIKRIENRIAELSKKGSSVQMDILKDRLKLVKQKVKEMNL